MSIPKKTALFSTNQLEGILDFAAVLLEKDWQIIATAQPYQLLRNSNLAVSSIHEFVGIHEDYGFPPTLHPKVEAALTNPDFPEQIELVYDITYGPHDGMDVGGNTLLALAVKGHKIPITSTAQMKLVSAWMQQQGDVPPEIKTSLQQQTLQAITDYYASLVEIRSQEKSRYFGAEFKLALLNGENPYQSAELWHLHGQADTLALTQYQLISSNLPCFTNIVDLDCLTETMTRIALAFQLNTGKQPYITLAAKHGNVCGIGVDEAATTESLRKALWGNPLAIWGGEVVTNFSIKEAEAHCLFSSSQREAALQSGKWMLDVIAAPEYTAGALAILTQRKNSKIFVNPGLRQPQLRSEKQTVRFTRGSFVQQSIPDYILNLADLEWTCPTPDPEKWTDLIISWAATFTSFHGGNEVALAKNGQLLGCAGGPSTVDAAETAVLRASRFHDPLQGACFAADAFFPFTDAPELLIQAGASQGTVPAGGMRYVDVKQYFINHAITVGFIPAAYRGFTRH